MRTRLCVKLPRSRGGNARTARTHEPRRSRRCGRWCNRRCLYRAAHGHPGEVPSPSPTSIIYTVYLRACHLSGAPAHRGGRAVRLTIGRDRLARCRALPEHPLAPRAHRAADPVDFVYRLFVPRGSPCPMQAKTPARRPRNHGGRHRTTPWSWLAGPLWESARPRAVDGGRQ